MLLYLLVLLPLLQPAIPAAPGRTLACQPRPEIQPRNITRAWLTGEDFYISWSDCRKNHCRITVAEPEDCIYDGVCDDDPESKVGITGCEFEERGIFIQSNVLGDWIFITIDDMAFKIREDEENDYLDYPDYNFEDPVINSDEDIAKTPTLPNTGTSTKTTAPSTAPPITATSTKTTAQHIVQHLQQFYLKQVQKLNLQFQQQQHNYLQELQQHIQQHYLGAVHELELQHDHQKQRYLKEIKYLTDQHHYYLQKGQ